MQALHSTDDDAPVEEAVEVPPCGGGIYLLDVAQELGGKGGLPACDINDPKVRRKAAHLCE